MNGDRISKQFTAVFGIFMVFFYMGIGVFLVLFPEKFLMDKAVLRLVGAAFILMGIYRIFSSIRNIREAFSSKKDEDE